MKPIIRKIFKLHFIAATTALLISNPICAQTFSVFDEPSDNSEQRNIDKNERLRIAMEYLNSPHLNLKNSQEDTFKLKASTIDSLGRLQARYVRYHKEILLIGGGIKVAVDESGVAKLNYSPTPFIPPESFIPKITKDEVWQKIARVLNVDPKELSGEIELALLLSGNSQQATLCWQVRATHPKAETENFTLNATTTDVIRRSPAIVHNALSTETSGSSYYYGRLPLTTSWDDDLNIYRLWDSTRGGTQVRDMGDSHHTPDNHGTIFEDDDNDWGNGEDWNQGDPTAGPTGQTAAVEAMWGAQQTWDMLKNVFSLEGYDGNAEPMILRVHYLKNAGEAYTDAKFDGFFVNFGDSLPLSAEDQEKVDSGEIELENKYKSKTRLATISHELGHGIWDRQVTDLKNNKGEVSGLNEGHSDITAAIVMHYAWLADGEGAVIPTNNYGNLQYFKQRSVNPWAYKIDGQTGLAGWNVAMEFEEEHCQGTAYGHMFTILAMGTPSQADAAASPCTGSSFSCLKKSPYPIGIAGIGMDKAAHIWFTATVAYLDEDPTFHEARDAWLKAAKDLFGEPSSEYSAVMNAFYLINVGTEAYDLEPPRISINSVSVDNNEQTVLIDVESFDDVGVVSLGLKSGAGSEWTIHHGSEFNGYLDVDAISPGNYDVTARACDAKVVCSETIHPYVFTSANHLVMSKFDEALYWKSSNPGYLLKENPDKSFLGDGYVSFINDEWMQRQVSIPDEATSVTFGYRLQVNADAVANPGALWVEILTQDGLLLEVLHVVTDAVDTYDETSRNYKKFSFTSSDYAGQTIKMRFRGDAVASNVYSVDQVFIVFQAIPVASLNIEVDEVEGSVIYTSTIDGIHDNRIDFVEFSTTGVDIGIDEKRPHNKVLSTDLYETDVVLNGRAKAYDYFGQIIADTGPQPFEVKSVNHLISNGHFNWGLLSWLATDDAVACFFNPVGGEGPEGFIGEGCIVFTGSGTISQNITIPAEADSALLSLRFKNKTIYDSVPAAQQDMLVVNISNADTDVDLGVIHGTVDTSEGISTSEYRKLQYSLSDYIGMNIKLTIAANHGSGETMRFYVDNVGVSSFVLGGVVIE